MNTIQLVILQLIMFLGSNQIISQTWCRIKTDKDSVEVGDPLRVEFTIPKQEKLNKIKIDFSKIKNLSYDSTQLLSEEYADVQILNTEFENSETASDYAVFNINPTTTNKFYIDVALYGPGIFDLSPIISHQDSFVAQCTGSKIVVFLPAEILEDTSLQIKDINPIIIIPKSVADYLNWILGFVILLGITGFLLYRRLKYKMRKKNMEIRNEDTRDIAEPNPEEIALKRLMSLADKQDWKHGRQKEYHSELTEILRWYLSKKYNFKALESTTSEIIQKLSKYISSSDDLNFIHDALNIADLVKFAKVEATEEINENILERSIRFVKQRTNCAEQDKNENL